MGIEDLKKKLKELLDKKKLAKSIQAQIQRKKEEIDGLHGVSFDTIRVQGGNFIPLVERYILSIEKLESVYDNLLTEIFETEDFISDNLQYLTPIEQTIIVERYMSGKSWRKIQQEMNYADRQPYDISKKALLKLSKRPQ